jgi:hypothetical protein
MSMELKTLAPALCSAGGIIAGTLLAVVTMKQAWPLQTLGPLVLAASILGSDVLVARAQGSKRGPSGTSIFLALTFLAALLIIGLGNRDMLPTMLPILGGGIASPLLGTKKKSRNRSTEDGP